MRAASEPPRRRPSRPVVRRPIHRYPRRPLMHITAIDSDPLTLHLVDAFLDGPEHSVSTHGSVDSLGDDELAACDVVMLNVRMHGVNGLDVLAGLKARRPQLAIIVLTGTDDVRDAVRAMRSGAFEFLAKPFTRPTLVDAVDRAAKATRDGTVPTRTLGMDPAATTVSAPSVAEGRSTTVIESDAPVLGEALRTRVVQTAGSHATVFIGGETGTGKTTVAKTIHAASPRAAGPFIPINCAAIPGDLLHSELFGHTRGSFTGAVDDRIGQFEAAAGGTLFLDEIGDLPLPLQPKLLTFLQDRTVRPLGSTASREVDVRLITATHRDLSAMCREGLFRQDLYFRLMVLRIDLPALRDRQSEFGTIAEGVLRALCRRHSIPARRLDGDAVAMLRTLPWHGNIRELENVLERSLALCPREVIGLTDVFAGNAELDRRTSVAIAQPAVASEPHPAPVAVSVRPNDPVADAASGGYRLAGRTLAEIERDAIIETMRLTSGNKAKAARTLGISEKSVYNKMKRLKIDPSSYQPDTASIAEDRSTAILPPPAPVHGSTSVAGALPTPAALPYSSATPVTPLC